MDWLNVYEAFEDLPKSEKMRLFDAIKDSIFPGPKTPVDAFTKELRESRFSNGVACLHCGSVCVKRNGKYRSRQRYLCKDCGTTFNDATATPIAGTRYPDKWKKYFEYMVQGLTLPKIAKKLDIHISTAFYWRHKILNAIRSLDVRKLQGIVESDETFFLESLKGKKKITHRKPRKSGGKSKMRGISHEQVCVVVAVDRTNGVVSKVAGKGRVTAKELDAVLGKTIAPKSQLCTDSARNYKLFASKSNIEHHAVNLRKGILIRKGIYHIQHVNAYHARLKTWVRRFNGVATKYLDNYLFWFRFLELHKKLDEAEIQNVMLLDSCKKPNWSTVQTFRTA
ncbi:IS1595 family transposase [Paenibacillus sp. LHD-38]|uniref:IS1595 family transposase n=1 Tax=Paenibacillus sp. LHD-38 TaxID=3072143 RepID=UPI00280DC5CB|nr:IS1595 family transposase [Paenibacillus sp. LHD-38]MDQ8738034.1 IS1595 family transposase [Paenibacillus sp. LHD-38]